MSVVVVGFIVMVVNVIWVWWWGS